MKKFLVTLAALFTLMVSASAMSYEQACQQALFLTDKMAYELNLTDDQYEAAYEVNLDYLMSIGNYDDLYGVYWQQRNLDLSYILLDWQYRAFVNASYFYRPLYWRDGFWHFAIYGRYPHRDYFFFGRPHFFHVYRGGHSWRVNGGRSWYHGRDFGPRPGREKIGMRDGFDRGDYGRGARGLDQHGGRNGNHGGGNIGNNGGRNGGQNGRGMDNGNRNRSSFGGGQTHQGGRGNGGNLDHNGGATGTQRPQTDLNHSTRQGSSFDRNGATATVRESSTRQTVTQSHGSAGSTGVAPSTSTRSGADTSTRSTGSTSLSQSSSSKSRAVAGGPSIMSTTRNASRSSSTSTRSMSSSSSHSVGSSSRSTGSSMSRGSSAPSGSRGVSGGGSRGGGGHFGGHR